MKTPLDMVLWAFENPWYCLGALVLWGAIGLAYFVLVMERTKTRHKLMTDLIPWFLVSLLAIPPVIFGLGLIEMFTGEHTDQLIFALFTLLIAGFGFYLGFESAEHSITSSKEDPINPTQFIRISLKKNKWPILRTNFVIEGALASFGCLLIAMLYGMGMLLCWSAVQWLLPDTLPGSRTQLASFFNELNYSLAFFFGSLGTSCFFYGRATVFKYAANTAITHMNKIHISENYERTYANRQSTPVHPKNDWSYENIFLKITEDKKKNES